jgi:hypothetical protein
MQRTMSVAGPLPSVPYDYWCMGKEEGGMIGWRIGKDINSYIAYPL